MSLNSIQSIPSGSLLLLVGRPGSGKSTFCNQTVLKTIVDKPTIYVTTESPPSKVAESLEELGLSKKLPNPISYVDSYNKTIGLSESTPLVVEEASSENLTSIGIAITKLQRRIKKEYFLVFDSLTSPYLMNGRITLDFLRKMLLRLASQGNSVLVSFDEGCGKSEDLVAMMSIANGIIKIELQEKLKTFNVVKHPIIAPSKITVPIDVDSQIQFNFNYKLRALNAAKGMRLMRGSPVRKEVGDFVHVFWLNLSRWSGMLWDPMRFPTMEYNSNKCLSFMIKDERKTLPLRIKLLLRLILPKKFSSKKDVKRLWSFASRKVKGNQSSIGEYLENDSKKDDHYFRWFEGDTCFGFDNVGARLALGTLGIWAGYMRGFEKDERDWNWIETKCIGLGDPYCEARAIPSDIDETKSCSEIDQSKYCSMLDETKSWLESIDNEIIERVFDILMERLAGYLEGKTLWDRPKLGPYVSLLRFSDIMVLPAIESLRYREALRLGGVIAGKKVGEKMLSMGLKEEAALNKIIQLLEYCKVGKVSIGKRITIRECCESVFLDAKDLSCFFTTGFLNGFISTIKSQYVKKTKCVGKGDPHCEWEIR